MTLNWNDLEGVSLAGRYWLKQCLDATDADAWYLIRFNATCDAAVRVLRADLPHAETQLEAWREAMEFDHPNLSRILDAGRASAEGLDVIYVVCEWPDDFLAAALAERPMSTAEAAEVLRAAVAALAYVHERGFAHGAVDPRHIIAIGDTIKLPGDPVRRAGSPAPLADPDPAGPPEVVAGGAATAASDMWSLGMTLIEILTRQRPVLGPRDEAPFLPEPFGSIARHTLRHDPASRWSAAEIVAHLRPPEPPPVRVEEAPPVEPPRVAEPRPARPLPAPVPRHEPAVRREIPFKWVPLVGLLAAAAIGVVALRHPADVPAAAPAPGPAATRPATAPPARPPAAVRPPEPRPAANPDAVWRVIAFEYAKRDAAEKKVRAINDRHPSLHADVFAPNGIHGPFFVALGGRMTYAEADRLKRRARASGMPRDTFVRNYPR